MSDPGDIQDVPVIFPTVKEMTGWAFDALRAHPHGATITYPELWAIIRNDPTESRGRGAVLKAGRRLLLEHDKLLVNIKGVGYQIAQPNEHEKQSRRLQAASRRRLRRAAMAVAHVALEALTPDERAKVLTEQVKSGLALAFMTRIARRKTLPPKEQIALPSGASLVRLLTKKKAG